ncbi:MAG: hypothetical protein FWG40_06485 [Peptococcaceae bacterium]|nr:hypothetical protein [Peptococcaceae bacterium]
MGTGRVRDFRASKYSDLQGACGFLSVKGNDNLQESSYKNLGSWHEELLESGRLSGRGLHKIFLEVYAVERNYEGVFNAQREDIAYFNAETESFRDMINDKSDKPIIISELSLVASDIYLTSLLEKCHANGSWDHGYISYLLSSSDRQFGSFGSYDVRVEALSEVLLQMGIDGSSEDIEFFFQAGCDTEIIDYFKHECGIKPTGMLTAVVARHGQKVQGLLDPNVYPLNYYLLNTENPSSLTGEYKEQYDAINRLYELSGAYDDFIINSSNITFSGYWNTPGYVQFVGYRSYPVEEVKSPVIGIEFTTVKDKDTGEDVNVVQLSAGFDQTWYSVTSPASPNSRKQPSFISTAYPYNPNIVQYIGETYGESATRSAQELGEDLKEDFDNNKSNPGQLWATAVLGTTIGFIKLPGDVVSGIIAFSGVQAQINTEKRLINQSMETVEDYQQALAESVNTHIDGMLKGNVIGYSGVRITHESEAQLTTFSVFYDPVTVQLNLDVYNDNNQPILTMEEINRDPALLARLTTWCNDPANRYTPIGGSYTLAKKDIRENGGGAIPEDVFIDRYADNKYGVPIEVLLLYRQELQNQ